MHYQEFSSIQFAIAREKEIEGWRREKNSIPFVDQMKILNSWAIRSLIKNRIESPDVTFICGKRQLELMINVVYRCPVILFLLTIWDDQ